MLELGAMIQLIPAVALFVAQHWDSIMTVCTALVLLFQALKTREYAKIWPQTLDAVRAMAELELSGPEKRKAVAASIREMLPPWLKALVSDVQAERLAEQAYQFMRGELKQEGK